MVKLARARPRVFTTVRVAAAGLGISPAQRKRRQSRPKRNILRLSSLTKCAVHLPVSPVSAGLLRIARSHSGIPHIEKHPSRLQPRAVPLALPDNRCISVIHPHTYHGSSPSKASFLPIDENPYNASQATRGELYSCSHRSCRTMRSRIDHYASLGKSRQASAPAAEPATPLLTRV